MLVRQPAWNPTFKSFQRTAKKKTLTTISDFTFTFYSTLFACPLNLGTAFETYSVTTSALTPWTSRTTRLEGLTYLAEENRLDK